MFRAATLTWMNWPTKRRYISVPDFIEAAHRSKNWSAEALYSKLSKAFAETYGDVQAGYVKAKTLLYIEKVYGEA